MAKLRSARLESPPERVGSFRIEGALGVGGMGAVYRAWDERLHRTVAIKHVLPDSTDDRARERLRREAQAAAGLNHPSIVQIYDIFEEDGVDWIIMELVEGQTMSSLIEAGRLGLAEAVVLVREIAEGLAEAHGKGVVHRDLKTENVMVTRSFHAKILDFGLAKNMGVPIERLSGVTSVLGTSRTMSPEQAMGEEVDHRSDLFSLGILTFEAVTGQPPFVGASPFKTLAKVCSSRHAPAHQVNRRVPIELSNLIDRLLEKSPAHRPQSAREVVVELRFLEKQRLPEWGGAYAPGHDVEPPSEILAASNAPERASAPAAPRVVPEPAPAKPAPVRIPPPPGAPPEEEGTAVISVEGLPWRGESGETSEMPIFQPSALPGFSPNSDRPTIVLRTLLAVRASESRFEPQLRRFFDELQRRHRVRWGELGAILAETDSGPIFLFERPISAVLFAVFVAEAADEEGSPLLPRFGVHVGEVILGPGSDHSRHALRAGGPTCRVPYRLADLAAPGQVLVTPETAALARRALLQQERELDWRELGPLYFDELRETLQPFEAIALHHAPARTA